jgi:hypothetical protein
MSELQRQSLERTLAVHSAPTLLGIKCANLISVQLNGCGFRSYQREFECRSGLQMRVLCQCRGRQLLYVWHEALLAMQLGQPDVRAFLSQYGYTEKMDSEQMLSHLAGRMRCGEFPHEIGIFLGIPLADVQGFIANHGRNCLLCGCWKVYSDPESARQTFANYNRCREILCDKLNQGCGFFRALELSKEELL